MCAGEGLLHFCPDEVETIDGVLLHNVGGEYHRVANGIPVAIVKGKVVDLIDRNRSTRPTPSAIERGHFQPALRGQGIETEAAAAESKKVWNRKRKELAIQQANEIAKLERQHEITLEEADDTLDAELEEEVALAGRTRPEQALSRDGRGGHQGSDRALARQPAEARSTDRATAIMALYTGVLALVFSGHGQPVAVAWDLACGLLELLRLHWRRRSGVREQTSYYEALFQPTGQLPSSSSCAPDISPSSSTRRSTTAGGPFERVSSSLAVGVAFLPAVFLTTARHVDILEVPAPLFGPPPDRQANRPPSYHLV